MKVKELIEILQKEDGELDVFASPLILMEMLQADSGAAESSKSFKKTASPYEKFPVRQVGLSRDISAGGGGSGDQSWVVLGYDPVDSDLPDSLTPEEFIN